MLLFQIVNISAVLPNCTYFCCSTKLCLFLLFSQIIHISAVLPNCFYFCSSSKLCLFLLLYQIVPISAALFCQASKKRVSKLMHKVIDFIEPVISLVLVADMLPLTILKCMSNLIFMFGLAARKYS